MAASGRDNFKGTIIKFFLLALLLMFMAIGVVKQLFFGFGVMPRAALPSAAGGQIVAASPMSK